MLYILGPKGKSMLVKNDRRYEKVCIENQAGKCGSQRVNEIVAIHSTKLRGFFSPAPNDD